VRHTGYVDRELRLKKLRRDSKILMEEHAERPDDPFVLFNLGSIAIEMRDWREALDFLRRSLRGSAPTDSITRKLFALIARSHQMLGEPQQALSACATGLERLHRAIQKLRDLPGASEIRKSKIKNISECPLCFLCSMAIYTCRELSGTILHIGWRPL
jgi:predicted Zn-dependent protease